MPGSVGSFTFRLPGKEIVLSSEPFVCLGRHIRSHIRGIEGTVQLWLRVCFSARALYIRPQRKLACRRLFQISVIWVPSFPKFPLTYKACGFVVCIIFHHTHIVNRFNRISSKKVFKSHSFEKNAKRLHFGLAFHAESVYTLSCAQIAIRLQFRQLKHFSSLRLFWVKT